MDLSVLNREQREAVECLDGPLLVLAGAGSGKTRVLTYRIANLVEHGVKPWNILALTFTNKAAREMRERVSALVGEGAEELWVTTFHSCCAKILRIDGERLGYERGFSIYDDSDQMKAIGEILKELGISEKAVPKRELKEHISNAKNKSVDPEKYIEENYSDGESITMRVFTKYRKKLMAANAMDFDDLLLNTLSLFDTCPDILEKYRAKFKYVLVDEYQDTNMPQYRIVELLSHEHNNICVVGDDDQSIYGWRGADIRNIMSFEKDFKNTKVVKLEENYRSTKTILDAANDVICRNKSRKDKRLRTSKGLGEKITHYEADNERDEASYICRMIQQSVDTGASYGDFAILYRMNAQSRVIESTLVNYGIPHKVYGGFRFYERKEIVDILAYLRTIANPKDDMAFLRIVNVPRRGIGEKALEELTLSAVTRGESLLEAVLSPETLPPKLATKLKPFSDMMAEFMALSTLVPTSELTEKLINDIKYEEYLLSDDKKGDAETRMDNLRELVGNIKEIEADVPEGESALTAFLENVALISDIDAMNGEASSVSLMTLHSAKGLEFPTVFIAGMEDNIFPTRRARMELTSDGMEEERRLCYVGITRAKEKLYLISSKMRSIFGDTVINPPSSFLKEIPEELIEEKQAGYVRPETRIVFDDDRAKTAYASSQGFGAKQQPSAAPRKPVPEPSAAGSNVYAPFMKVVHAKFGEGTVLEVAGSGGSATVTVDFNAGGTKRFAAAYAPLTIIE